MMRECSICGYPSDPDTGGAAHAGDCPNQPDGPALYSAVNRPTRIESGTIGITLQVHRVSRRAVAEFVCGGVTFAGHGDTPTEALVFLADALDGAAGGQRHPVEAEIIRAALWGSP